VKKFLLSGLAILLAMGLMGGAFAYFQDTEESTGNTLTAGTLDLQVKDDGLTDPDPWGDGVDLTWVMADMIPGVSTVTNTVDLRNVGSLAGNHVEISFSHSIDEAGLLESDTDPNSNPEDLAKWIRITSMVYDGVDILSILTNANDTSWIDLEDVTLSPNTDVGGPLDNLPPPGSVGGTATFTMSLKFRAEATNDIQGDILTTTVTFTLNQYSSQ